MTAKARAIADSWHQRQVLDVLPEMTALTCRTAIGTMFSTALPEAR
jgi:cytochrome P450